MSEFVTRQHIVFVDDDDALRAATVQSLELADIDVRPFADAEAALAEIDGGFAGAIVTDIRMPRLDGLEFFARVRAIDPDIPVILITGHADVPMAIGALKSGAFDFLAKPFATDHLVATVRKALDTRRLVLDNRMLRAAAETSVDSPLTGDSPVMAQLRATILQVAQADIDVLVEGETGTGKELAALILHRKGPRSGRPFVAVDCGALPEQLAEVELFGHDRGVPGYGPIARAGRIEQANRGTLFLDGIDTMPLAIQAKLLRVVEERKIQPIGAAEPRGVDLRIIASSRRDLQLAVQARRISRRSFLSAERRPHPHAPAARTQGRYSATVRSIRRRGGQQAARRRFRPDRCRACASDRA
ncbi:sigma-54 dependent transcriptional regulator [Sphingopyxis sp. PET50]|uniref:sigma-54-dependent transcriptional regulator n=1 Tax=Sphingopyxis sp. PET50 TaxID=2976533 RepID=UPI0021AF0A0B|nr:sigma-54 dependent transcriptional regulator [Sphingopyxis sp. PET50]